MLQHTTGVADETALAMGAENPYGQYFCGDDHFAWKAPVDATSMVIWRQRLQGAGMEKIFKATIVQAVQTGE